MSLKLNLFLPFLLSGAGAFAQPHAVPCDSTVLYCYDGGIPNDPPGIYCRAYEIDTGTVPQVVRDLNRAYLEKRLGAEWLKRTRFDHALQIVPDTFRQGVEIQCKPLIWYALGYRIQFHDSVVHYFSVYYDQEGKLLYEPSLPSLKRNAEPLVFVDLCEAKRIAETNKKYPGKVHSAHLLYSEKYNCFVWEMRLPVEYELTKERMYEPAVLINVHNGKILGYQKRKRHLPPDRF